MSSILTLLTELVLLGARILALYREAKRKEWVKEGRLLSEALKDAKTDDDRAALARRLFDRRML
jgi:hypothetical protein